MIPPDVSSAFLSSFALVALAEFGDKTQLVCMALATRYRAWPVILGASGAFLLLNALAVLFGAGVGGWLPERITAAGVAVLFAAFGVRALMEPDEEDDDQVAERPGRGVFLTTLVLIFAAEFGDKTQIAVAGLAASMSPGPVWVGASAALIAISALGVWAGRTILQRLSRVWLHRLGGGLFLLFAAVAAWRAVS